MKEFLDYEYISQTQLDKDHTINEEAIRVLLSSIKEEKDIDISFVKYEETITKIKELLDNSYLEESKEIYYPMLVQSGHRASLEQGDTDSIHYTACALFITGDKKYITILDAYKSTNSYLAPSEQSLEFNKFLEEHDIELFIAGGEKIQKDMNNCITFSLDHLLQLSEEAPSDFYKFLIENTDNLDDSRRIVSWDRFSPNYVWNAQSVSYLLHYQKGHLEQLNKEYPPFKYSYQERTKESFRQVVLPDGTAKIRNTGIKISCKFFSDMALTYNETLSSPLRFNLMYRMYPRVLSVIETAAAIGNINHKVHELIFGRVDAFNKLFNNDSVFNIFANKSLLELIDNDHISVDELMHTVADDRYMINKSATKSIYKNLEHLSSLLVLFRSLGGMFNNVLSIMTDNTALKALSNPVIQNLILRKKLSFNLAARSIPKLLPKNIDAQPTPSRLDAVEKSCKRKPGPPIDTARRLDFSGM